MKLGIMIPALNEEEKIGETIQKLPKKLKGIKKIYTLVVDDGSTDNTSVIARKAGAEVISHGVNRGVGVAYQTGVDWALSHKLDILVNIDADGQFDPDEIPNLIKPILENRADLVVGDRFTGNKPKNMSKTKYVGNKMMSKLISKLARVNLQDVSSGFRVANKEALLNLNLLGNFTYTQESILDLATKGLKIVNVPVTIKYFPNRKSRVASSVSKYALKTSLIIFRSFRDYEPLKFFGWIGLSLFCVGLIGDVYVLQHYIRNNAFSPYISVLLTGIFFNSLGLAVITLGIIADMLDRIRKNQEKIIYLQKLTIYD